MTDIDAKIFRVLQGGGEKLKKGEFCLGESFRGVVVGLLVSDVHLLISPQVESLNLHFGWF